MNNPTNTSNKSTMSFNTRFAIAVVFTIAICILIGYVMRLLFDTDTFVPVIVAPISILFVNYKKMKSNYLAKNN